MSSCPWLSSSVPPPRVRESMDERTVASRVSSIHAPLPEGHVLRSPQGMRLRTSTPRRAGRPGASPAVRLVGHEQGARAQRHGRRRPARSPARHVRRARRAAALSKSGVRKFFRLWRTRSISRVAAGLAPAPHAADGVAVGAVHRGTSNGCRRTCARPTRRRGHAVGIAGGRRPARRDRRPRRADPDVPSDRPAPRRARRRLRRDPGRGRTPARLGRARHHRRARKRRPRPGPRHRRPRRARSAARLQRRRRLASLTAGGAASRTPGAAGMRRSSWSAPGAARSARGPGPTVPVAVTGPGRPSRRRESRRTMTHVIAARSRCP
jgi:hypothetical protein